MPPISDDFAVRYTPMDSTPDATTSDGTFTSGSGIVYGLGREEMQNAAMFDFRSIHTYADYNDVDSAYNMKLFAGVKRKIFGRRLVKMAPRANDSYWSYEDQLKIDEANGINTDEYMEVPWTYPQMLVICLCYLVILLTLPFSLLLSVKKIGEYQRLVVFRIGRLNGLRKPGYRFVLPCIDNCKVVDVRPKAFNVPPIQAVSCDNGIVQIGATIYYKVVDAISAVTAVQDWNSSMRALAHTTLHKLVNKRKSNECQDDRPKISAALMEELNIFMKSWGMKVTEVDLSDATIMKEGESHAAHILRTLMRPEVRGQLMNTIGQLQANSDSDSKKLTKEEGMSIFQGFAPLVTSPSGRTSLLANGEPQPVPQFDLPGLAAAPQGGIDFGKLMSSMFGVEMPNPSGSTTTIDTIVDGNTTSDTKELSLDKLIATLAAVVDSRLVQKVGYVYQVHCVGMGDFYMDLKNGCGHIAEGKLPDGYDADVTFTVTAEDLLDLLLAQLNPMDAYLSGRLTMQGDTRAAMKLQVLGEHIKANFKR